MTDQPSSLWNNKLTQFGQLLEQMAISDHRGQPQAIEAGINAGIAMFAKARAEERRVFVIGNGGSAAVASHIVNDFVNCGRLKATVVHDPSLLTCMANDYGYEHAYARILDVQAGEGDLLVAISSSGNSANIRNAVAVMRQKQGQVMTLSGFADDNPLRTMGDLNYWLNARHYGFVEIGHLYILHHLLDRFKEEVP